MIRLTTPMGSSNEEDTHGATAKAKGCAGVPKDTAAPRCNVSSLKETFRIGMYIGMDACEVQVGREVAAEEVANVDQNK